MKTVTGVILQAIRKIEKPEEKRDQIESIVGLIKKDKNVWDLFWEEYYSLGEYTQKLIKKNIPKFYSLRKKISGSVIGSLAEGRNARLSKTVF